MAKRPETEGYAKPYADFDSPLMRLMRQEAYGEDIGQHSWVTVDELRSDIERLKLSQSSRLLDLGCGPGGPLTYILQATGCIGTGVDVNRPALDAARIRAASHGVERQMILREADLNEVVPLSSRSFDVVISIDVVLHVQDRAQLFSDVARLLTPGGKFLFTDAAVMTGTLSKEEVAARSIHGFIQFSAPGLNESQLEHCGFRLLESEDRTASLLSNANGRLTARSAHWSELTSLEGPEYFARQQRYLETVIALAERGALTRRMYLAEVEDAA